ncbi:MAG: DEAD/DEAH box helicase [Planctomycetota bacterium]|jgi:hypothetical protein
MLWAVLFLAAGAGVLAGAYRQSPLRRMRRALKETLDTIRAETRNVEAALRGRMGRLEEAAGTYTEAHRRARREEVPVSSLRDAGAKNVQWSALEAAGVETLEDVLPWSQARLEALPGIGPTSAERVFEAAESVNRRLEAEPIPLPDPNLQAPSSAPCAAGALDVLEARDALGTVPRALQRHEQPLAEQMQRVEARSGFFRWLLTDDRAGYRTPEYQEAAAADRRVRAELESGLLEESRLRRGRLREAPVVERTPEALVEAFRNRYAEASALIESVLPGRPEALPEGAEESAAVVHPLARHLPLEIAQEVERFRLRVDGLRVTLRRYQAFGAKYLLVQGRTILGDEMGLGKTIEALAAMVHHRDAEGGRHFLVICPASITRNWIREVERRTELAAHLLQGSDRADAMEAWLRDGGVAVVSYATARGLDLDERLRRDGLRVGFLVADEAHYIKNPAAGRSRAVQELMDHAERVCLMSGTPMENHPREFCNLVELVRKDLAAPLRDEGMVLGDVVVEPDRFHKLVAPAYLRRNQQDVLRELPPKVEFEEWVDLGADQRAAYREAVFSRNIMAMRRSVTLAEDGAPSAKMDRLSELLDDHRESGRKVLVFSYFLPVLAEIERRFGVIGQITGAVSGDKRMDLVDAFHAADGHAILACQIQAGGVGLNLHAASAVVLMEPQWKPSTEEQAIARAHRMGQTETVLVHRLLARESVDERVAEILEGKLELFEAYARESLVKRASKQATEAALTDLVVAYEVERLRQTG